MSLQLALKTALAMKEYNDDVSKKETLRKKEWDEAVLVNGGVAWWCTTEQVVKQHNGTSGEVITKLTNVKKKVKVCVLTSDNEWGDTPNKGKFSFRNAHDCRIFLSVKSYRDAEKVVKEIYGIAKEGKCPYNITSAAV